jgi:hypothetical protein
MPFKSESQRRYLWLKHPDIAHRWAHEKGTRNTGLPLHSVKKKAKSSGKKKGKK